MNEERARPNSADRLAFASDHGGYELKQILMEYAKALGYSILDVGCFTADSVDYPDFAQLACEKVISGEAGRAVLICGTGVGMSIAANKMRGVRCALCGDTTSARLTREHNDSNALALGGRIVGAELAKDILTTWLTSGFAGGYHLRRVEKIMALENE